MYWLRERIAAEQSVLALYNVQVRSPRHVQATDLILRAEKSQEEYRKSVDDIVLGEELCS